METWGLQALVLNNKLTKIHPKTFLTTKKLRRLYLSHDQLSEIPLNLPKSLAELRIHDNKVKKIQKDTFKGMNALHVLEMSANPLDNNGIEPGAFEGMTVFHIRIAEAKLTSIPKGGVLLLENPKGDNQLNLEKLKNVITSIFGVKSTGLSVFHGGTEIQNQTDLLSLSGRTLCVTAGASPAPATSPSTLLCQYINLQLVNAEPQECLTGTVGTLLLENPLGQNGLTHQGLVYEAAKVFGLRSRRLKLFLNETQTQEITEDIPMKTLNMKTVYDSVLPTTADG